MYETPRARHVEELTRIFDATTIHDFLDTGTSPHTGAFFEPADTLAHHTSGDLAKVLRPVEVGLDNKYLIWYHTCVYISTFTRMFLLVLPLLPHSAAGVDAAVLYAQHGASIDRCMTGLGFHLLPRPGLSRSISSFSDELLFWGGDSRKNDEIHLPRYFARLKAACEGIVQVGTDSVKVLIVLSGDAGIMCYIRGGRGSNDMHPFQSSHMDKFDMKDFLKVMPRTMDRIFRELVFQYLVDSGATMKEMKKLYFAHSLGITGFSLSPTSDDLTMLCASHLFWRMVLRFLEAICTYLRTIKKLTPFENCVNACAGVKCKFSRMHPKPHHFFLCTAYRVLFTASSGLCSMPFIRE
jgi:hypothetical protein